MEPIDNLLGCLLGVILLPLAGLTLGGMISPFAASLLATVLIAAGTAYRIRSAFGS